MTALPGGISSFIRRLPDLDGRPFLVDRSHGPFVEEATGQQHVDHVLAMGATILGDGRVAFIVDVAELHRIATRRKAPDEDGRSADGGATAPVQEEVA